MKLPTLYTRTANGAINFWRIATDGARVHSEWGQVDTASPQSEEYYAEAKNVGRTNETTPADQAELEACSKWDKRKRLKYVESIEAARGNVNLKPMLAHVLDAKHLAKLRYPVDVQPKLNGCRCMAHQQADGSVRLMSRGGKDYHLPHIERELHERIPEGWVLDGELYLHGASLQRIRSLLLTPQIGSEQVLYVCYDLTHVPSNDLLWSARRVELDDWFKMNRSLRSVAPINTVRVHSAEAINAAHDSWVQEGYEGVIVRTLEGTYRLGYRSHDLLKLKSFKDEEFRVIGYRVGKDGVIVYRCQQEQGIAFEVVPKGDEAERAELLRTADDAVGHWLTVKYQERSDRNVPLIVSGLGLRPEKDR